MSFLAILFKKTYGPPVTVTDTISNTYYDGYMVGGWPSISHVQYSYTGSGPTSLMNFGRYNGICEALMYFNLSSPIPAGAVINSAVVSGRQAYAWNPGGGTFATKVRAELSATPSMALYLSSL